jgi:signal transduction histidine kinase/DNA-binding response OmpR family regulator/CHASE3 domain sensor protein
VPQQLQRPRGLLPTKSIAALIVALGAITAITVLTYRSMRDRETTVNELARATSARNILNRVLVQLEQAQGGQRAYLLLGESTFLRMPELARATIPTLLEQLRDRLEGKPDQLQRLGILEPLARTRLDVIDETVRLKREGRDEQARAVVADGRGRAAMDGAREQIFEMLATIEATIESANASWTETVARSSYVTFGGSGVLLTMILVLGLLASRDYRSVQRDNWVRGLQLEIGTQLQGDARIESVGQKVLEAFVPHLAAQLGAVYVCDGDHLRRVAGHALPADSKDHLDRGQGLTGQAVLENRLVHLTDVPKDYLPITSALGGSVPREVVIAPASIDGTVHAVVELGFLHPVEPIDLEALVRIGETVASAMRAARDRGRLQALLDETQRQAEELQAQQEELRVTNEELEQQTKALQVSQAQLENQQSELEQINTQLEEQAQALERQRDDLAKSTVELQRATEYKSQFLANMSHELRTPLNSSLILAKLLADNRERTLSDEQVTFAKTIYSAGNDLLTLINDILDLSKIEAGMLEVRTEPVTLSRLVDDLRTTFAPIAAEKQLALELSISRDVPATITTDGARLQQIVRNLLSNALKFTERGGVTLEVRPQDDQIAIAVRDTGIGIAPDQHALIFEAFRQADGTSNRKFSGTGLGLSISRDLARLLGGDITLDSTPGRGTTFTLVLPTTAPARLAQHPRAASQPAVSRVPAPPRELPPAGNVAPSTAIPSKARPGPFEDDRAKITPGSRSLLVIEDDVSFARVLYDLSHELEFVTAVAGNGDDGIALARELSPSAIVLDISLPDRSGLAVLDALKRDPRTRHVPVHIVSAHDYARTALAMGAAGYALKPVERDRLVDALKKLEDRITRKLRRVLVVEDDPTLRESTARLLNTDDVESVTAGTTAEALELLRTSTFDCMVLDLELPDRSGLQLLEEMARHEQYSFPPVIVYTGHSLSSTQVHELERFSHSIIIKGARSPERLLDEVTLFLHQVESELPPERQRMLRDARDREAAFEGRKILIVEDDVRNVFALSAVLEPKGGEGRDRPQRPRGARVHERQPGGRSRPDGHHDAGDGWARGDARAAQGSTVLEAADHRVDRQGDGRRS